jgi:hypothetical protein
MRDGGKGDKKRPLTIPKEQFESNWDKIFKKPVKQDKPFGLDNVVDETNKRKQK